MTNQKIPDTLALTKIKAGGWGGGGGGGGVGIQLMQIFLTFIKVDQSNKKKMCHFSELSEYVGKEKKEKRIPHYSRSNSFSTL